ncbi:acetyl-CoA carboxylase, carboxyltransferase subunit beta [Desulfuribacillus alkaliarsenatis]|uniref:Acetyl-coenzyme A carboxylase carboxyl transferase subunit beta n=1 Tax=Desulfuribacillus alkaliarsenatis TaxID=766136 RepID=A0A1E5FYD8_9FIRM|nr:acetyl-CoA carboxylase, carboxyltransferase subunit beta [Desulfuribacillus alkaliarsenatis]OEF95580.1 acetyl-CoA carboxylase subunit beta [Desulfuribacillus alkaliarsenatis]
MLKDLFTKKKKYASVSAKAVQKDVPQGIIVKCSDCSAIIYAKELDKNYRTCIKCNFHFPITAKERISYTLDNDNFFEYDTDLSSCNPLEFPDYNEKLASDKEKTGLNEAVITGEGTIEGIPLVVAVMDSRFRMASMGSVVGEKIARAIEKAMIKKYPFILFSASGGARMQEGIFSLMQMAKTSAALKEYDKAGGLFVSVMTNPTTGGVTASFASLGDINVAEPGALIGFAGRRIIEQTIRQKLPDDFQTAEFLVKHGHLDKVVHRKDMREFLSTVLKLHAFGGERIEK